MNKFWVKLRMDVMKGYWRNEWIWMAMMVGKNEKEWCRLDLMWVNVNGGMDRWMEWCRLIKVDIVD
jgi:hypothetical protein